MKTYYVALLALLMPTCALAQDTTFDTLRFATGSEQVGHVIEADNDKLLWLGKDD